MTEILYREESYKIIGICMNIHRSLGMGLKEINYKDAMEIDFREQQVPYYREKRFKVVYKETVLNNPYIADFVVFDSIVLEIKSSSAIVDAHIAQAISYLNVSALKLALIINFGERSLNWKRVIL